MWALVLDFVLGAVAKREPSDFVAPYRKQKVGLTHV